jgi:tryptophanyl-tRNA synthetase
MKATIFSGIKPSGEMHIGGYIGSLKQWVAIQNNPSLLDSNIKESELYFSIVNLHALTTYQEPSVLGQRSKHLAAIYLASGLDAKKCTLFEQSTNPDHAYLNWLLSCITSMGQLERMTQYKNKVVKLEKEISAGLFNYPTLMASDILLYGATHVPVGEDQKQHIELTRDIAERFNNRYAPVFTLPTPVIQKEGKRIMSLQNPLSKMSKSENDPLGTINMLDTQDDIAKKVSRAVTDSMQGISYDPTSRPAVANLLEIFAAFDEKTRSAANIAVEYRDKGNKTFKDDLISVIFSSLSPIQNKYNEYIQLPQNLDAILQEGTKKAIEKSSIMLNKVKEVMGIE